LKDKLEASPIKVSMKAGPNGRLFGAVKTVDVADAVKAQGIGEIDKRKVELSGSIRSTGKFEATVRLNAELVARLSLQVVAAK